MESAQDKRIVKEQETFVIKPEMKPKSSPNTDLLGDPHFQGLFTLRN